MAQFIKTIIENNIIYDIYKCTGIDCTFTCYYKHNTDVIHREIGPAICNFEPFSKYLYDKYYFDNNCYPEIKTNKAWIKKVELIIEEIIT